MRFKRKKIIFPPKNDKKNLFWGYRIWNLRYFESTIARSLLKNCNWLKWTIFTFKCSHNVKLIYLSTQHQPSPRCVCVFQSITTFHCYPKVWSDSRSEEKKERTMRRMKEIIINWFWKATECAQLKRLRELKSSSKDLLRNGMKINYQKECFFFFNFYFLLLCLFFYILFRLQL